MTLKHNGFWISGSALPGPPYTTDWEALAIVLKPGRGGSVVEAARLHVGDFALETKELAESFGLEIARIIVDECLNAQDI